MKYKTLTNKYRNMLQALLYRNGYSFYNNLPHTFTAKCLN
jgi:hypothetical protein